MQRSAKGPRGMSSTACPPSVSAAAGVFSPTLRATSNPFSAPSHRWPFHTPGISIPSWPAQFTDSGLRATVLAEKTQFLKLYKSPAADGAYALGKPGESVRLANGWFLRMLLSFRVEPSQSANGAMKLKTLSSLFQYQRVSTDVFRYEYFRRAANRYAPGHLHVRGRLDESDVSLRKGSLEDVHFPTGRVGIEGIIRLLVDDFNVGAHEPDVVWRPLPRQTEAEFIRIARQPEADG